MIFPLHLQLVATLPCKTKYTLDDWDLGCLGPPATLLGCLGPPATLLAIKCY